MIPGRERKTAGIQGKGALAGTPTPGRGFPVPDGTTQGVHPPTKSPHMGEYLAAQLAAEVSRWVGKQDWRHQQAQLPGF